MSIPEHGSTTQQSFLRSRETNPVVRTSPPVRTFSSRELFAGSTEIAIEHTGSIYRLKITRQGKLILNK